MANLMEHHGIRGFKMLLNLKEIKVYGWGLWSIGRTAALIKSAHHRIKKESRPKPLLRARDNESIGIRRLPVHFRDFDNDASLIIHFFIAAAGMNSVGKQFTLYLAEKSVVAR